MGRLPVGAIATVALLLAGSSPVLATTEPCTPATFQPELLQNPSFETGNIAPWVAHKLCTGCDDSTLAEIVKGDAKDGAWVFRDTIRDNTVRAINQTITVDKPGQLHNVSWWYRYDTLEGSLEETCAIRATIDYSNPLGQIGVFSTVPNTGWNLASLSWTPKGSAGLGSGGRESVFDCRYAFFNSVSYCDPLWFLDSIKFFHSVSYCDPLWFLDSIKFFHSVSHFDSIWTFIYIQYFGFIWFFVFVYHFIPYFNGISPLNSQIVLYFYVSLFSKNFFTLDFVFYNNNNGDHNLSYNSDSLRDYNCDHN